VNKLVNKLVEGDGQPGFDLPYEEDDHEQQEIDVVNQIKQLAIDAQVELYPTPNVDNLSKITKKIIRLCNQHNSLQGHE
jgi:hypothetical protein